MDGESLDGEKKWWWPMDAWNDEKHEKFPCTFIRLMLAHSSCTTMVLGKTARLNHRLLEKRSDHSFMLVNPHRPQDLRLLWWARKTPGPQSGQLSARTSFPSSTLYFDHLALAFGPSPITHRLLLRWLRLPMLPQQLLQQVPLQPRGLVKHCACLRDACECILAQQPWPLQIRRCTQPPW